MAPTCPQEMDEELEKVGVDRDVLKQTLGGKDDKLGVYQRNAKKVARRGPPPETLFGGLALYPFSDLWRSQGIKSISFCKFLIS
jgi:hypothetical protein